MSAPDLRVEPHVTVASVPFEGAPRSTPSPDVAAAPHPTTLRMQILTTEHWSLLASRGLAWNESFSRAGMYLSTLSGAMVALGLVAGISALGHLFTLFALVILPVVLFVGIATFVRMGAINYHDAMTVIGMNRIRGAYLELVPELEPYFVMGTHDDPPGVAITMAVPPNSPRGLHVLAATPFVVNVLNGSLQPRSQASRPVEFSPWNSHRVSCSHRQPLREWWESSSTLSPAACAGGGHRFAPCFRAREFQQPAAARPRASNPRVNMRFDTCLPRRRTPQ